MDMDMTLHFSVKETILFKWWKTSSVFGILVAMFITFVFCILYEGIKSFRYKLAVWNKQKQDQIAVQESLVNRENPENEIESDLVQTSGYAKKYLNYHRFLQGFLFGIQAVLAYALMLIAMTYNLNLIIALAIGEAVGYYIFTGSPFIDHQVADCC